MIDPVLGLVIIVFIHIFLLEIDHRALSRAVLLLPGWNSHGLSSYVSHDGVFIERRSHDLLSSRNDLASWEEHWINVVKVHLLELRILHFLKVRVLGLIVVISLVLGCVLVVRFMLLRGLRVNSHELRQRAHWSDHTFTPRHLLVINLHFHHLVSVFPAMRAWSYSSDIFGDHLVELFSLLLLNVFNLTYLGHLVSNCEIVSRRVQSSHIVIKRLIFGAISTLDSLFGWVVAGTLMSGALFARPDSCFISLTGVVCLVVDVWVGRGLYWPWRPLGVLTMLCYLLRPIHSNIFILLLLPVMVWAHCRNIIWVHLLDLVWIHKVNIHRWFDQRSSVTHSVVGIMHVLVLIHDNWVFVWWSWLAHHLVTLTWLHYNLVLLQLLCLFVSLVVVLGAIWFSHLLSVLLNRVLWSKAGGVLTSWIRICLGFHFDEMGMLDAQVLLSFGTVTSDVVLWRGWRLFVHALPH